MKRSVLAVVAAGLWINLSEFMRNELLFKQHWTDQFESLGLIFPSASVNGALWGLWGFLFAACLVAVRRSMSCFGTIVLCWTMGFILMWIVTGNLSVLPFALLPIAIPWSLIEVALGVVIAQSIIGNQKAEQPAAPLQSERARSD